MFPQVGTVAESKCRNEKAETPKSPGFRSEWRLLNCLFVARWFFTTRVVGRCVPRLTRASSAVDIVHTVELMSCKVCVCFLVRALEWDRSVDNHACSVSTISHNDNLTSETLRHYVYHPTLRLCRRGPEPRHAVPRKYQGDTLTAC